MQLSNEWGMPRSEIEQRFSFEELKEIKAFRELKVFHDSWRQTGEICFQTAAPNLKTGHNLQPLDWIPGGREFLESVEQQDQTGASDEKLDQLRILAEFGPMLGRQAS